VRGFGCALFIFGGIEMEKSIYPGFDKLEAGDARNRMLPLCDMLRSLVGDRDIAYIAESYYPMQLTGMILVLLEYYRGVSREAIESFSSKYLTEDWLFPADKLLELWGEEKLNNMFSDLYALL